MSKIFESLMKVKGHNRLSLALRLLLVVGWCFERSQPQRIISRSKTNFTLYSSYSIHKTLNDKSLCLKPQLFQIFHKETNTTHSIFHRTHQSRPESQNYIHYFEMPTQKEKNTTFLEPIYIQCALNTRACISFLY